MARLPLFALPLIGLLAGCAPPPPPPPPPPPAPEAAEAPPPFPHDTGWTALADVVLQADGADASATIPWPHTRVEVLGRDSIGLRVRCSVCTPAVSGRVDPDDLVYAAPAPARAAQGSLVEFVLAVRQAAAAHDLEALHAAAAPSFSYSLVGPPGMEAALAAWRWDEFRALRALPALLDRGLATRDQRIWAAPPAHFTHRDYAGLRAGFRRAADGSWQWLFLMEDGR